MQEEPVRLNGIEAIPYILSEDKEYILVPKKLVVFFADDLHFLLAESWEGGEEEDETPTVT